MKTTFEILLLTEFGLGCTSRSCKTGSTAEETFRNALNEMPKRLVKSWESIEFDFNGKTFDVCKEWWIETDLDFDNSVTISE